MLYNQLLKSFTNSYLFARSETLGILNALTDDKLQFKPNGEKWQPLYYQFNCIGRTQIVYTKAIESGTMDFSLFTSPHLPKKTDYQTKSDIQSFLDMTNQMWLTAIRKKQVDKEYSIAWESSFKPKPLVNHISSLQDHERIHHGQFICYFTFAHYELPISFKRNWAL